MTGVPVSRYEAGDEPAAPAGSTTAAGAAPSSGGAMQRAKAKLRGGAHEIAVLRDVAGAVLRLQKAGYTADGKPDPTRLGRAKWEVVFRHPRARLFVCIGIIFLNFWIYAEDPIAHSKSVANIPVLGRAYALVFLQYPSHAGLVLLKVLLWLAALVLGIWFSYTIIHQKLLSPRLRMFSGNKGSWFVAFFGTIIFMCLASVTYNLLLLIGGADSSSENWLTSDLGMSNSAFAGGAAVGTWLGDSITAFMVIDLMLQDVSRYPWWQTKARQHWRVGCNGKLRIISFWVSMGVATVLVVTFISTNVIKWDSINRGWVTTTELSRGFIASIITLFDFLIVIQDWEFPEFDTPQTVMLPGLGLKGLTCRPLRCMRRSKFTIRATGKWVQYGLIVCVYCLDLNLLKNQLFFTPLPYGMYTDDAGTLYAVQNATALQQLNNATAISWAVRQGAMSGDLKLNARYTGVSFMWKIVASIPGLFGVFWMLFLIRRHGHKVKQVDDKYGEMNASTQSFVDAQVAAIGGERAAEAASMATPAGPADSSRSLGGSGSGSCGCCPWTCGSSGSASRVVPADGTGEATPTAETAERHAFRSSAGAGAASRRAAPARDDDMEVNPGSV